jgi:dipeptidyl aminopeptidase/acylaminoacyl peptidase
VCRLRILTLGLMLVSSGVAWSAGADAPAFVAGDPSWSPDGESIAFDARLGETPPDVYAVGIDGSDLRNLTPEDPGWNVFPSWSRRGGSIAFETNLSDAQVARVRYSVVAPDGSGRRDLALSSAVGPIYWSAGDRYISFDGRFDAEVLAVGSACCDSERQLAPGVAGPWAPRVMRVAVGVLKRNDIHLVTASPIGTLRRPLTRGHENLRPLAWSRDGRWILFEGERGGVSSFDLYVIRVTTGRILRLAIGARFGTFSPDGKRVVYSTEKGGIYTVSTTGRARRRVTSDGVNPRWSPDGSWIAFQSGQEIDLVRPDGSGRRPLLGS